MCKSMTFSCYVKNIWLSTLPKIVFWALGAHLHLYKSRPGEAIDTILGLDFKTLYSCQGFVLFPIQTLQKVFSSFLENHHWTILFSIWTLETEIFKLQTHNLIISLCILNWFISAYLIRAVCSSTSNVLKLLCFLFIALFEFDICPSHWGWL